MSNNPAGEQFILIIYGPVCAGKSVTAKELMRQVPGVFRVTIDKVKSLISDFTTERYPLLPNQMVLAQAALAVESGLSLVVEGNRTIQKELWREYQALATKHGAIYLEINIEAKAETLATRFKERLIEAEAKGKNLSFTSLEAMAERNHDYFLMKKANLPTFSSDEMGVAERTKEILALLGR